MRFLTLAALLVASAAVPARALMAESDPNEMVPVRQTVPTDAARAPSADGIPPFLRWMLAPLKRGMFVRLPVVDTDPNRGITFGVMPIVVLQGKHDERIEQIHAPSVTFNKNFGVAPTYRYYYYPQEDASFMARASRAKFEHEVMLQYEDHSAMGSPYDIFLRGQQAADSGQRFFGVGPDTAKKAEANYKQEFWTYKWAVGAPLWRDAPMRVHLSQRYESARITNGPIPNLPDFHASFPTDYSERAQQTNETRLSVDYDTRDHGVTTSRGAYVDVYMEKAVHGFLSQYDYKRAGFDGRWFHPWESRPDWVFASQVYYEEILGPTPPFWLLPSLGGKYSLRAYGDGRYADRGVAAANVEQRFKVYEAKTAGVTTELQVAPFVGVGTVFDSPGRAAGRYARPVVGTAFRAVAKPQVVGSVDVGVGREGVSVFTDINYSF
ncbi:MAG: BamA/TamA family outer membrane protein [Elusimicrobia bacterium]|nr:BamA/TamA family outer membrane protein [Elusimicrobiota bacterium]